MPWVNVWPWPDGLSKAKRLAIAFPAAAGPERRTAIAMPALTIPADLMAVLKLITMTP
jgi:hypothetical protein